MTETKWKKGPWVRRRRLDGSLVWPAMIGTPADESGSLVQVFGLPINTTQHPWRPDAHQEEANATADLIAAAPDLYKALRDCISQIEALCSPLDPNSFNVPDGARAALAKARGETP